MLRVDPGQPLEYENRGVQAILIILEGSGELDGKLCRPPYTVSHQCFLHSISLY
jgi:hypothetical protein